MVPRPPPRAVSPPSRASPRLRYTTSHPRDMDDDLIAAHRDLPALMPYLHLPVQAGSDRVLAAMNRRHTGDAYRRLIDRVRAARPDIALSSDFIVGFPGETRRRLRRHPAARAPRSASPAPSPSSTAPAPARRRPRSTGRCRRRRRRSASPSCRPCSRASARPSTAEPSAGPWTFSWRSRAGIPASSPARRPTSRPCRSTADLQSAGLRGGPGSATSCRCGSRAGNEQPVRRGSRGRGRPTAA